ncbi:major histocompatibility complex class I-related gene protein-like [Cheilinus undulatus]|uniref:major histocompatibility complex class I-related gene protein-like n=1 Tax=Cheilinus undulatus TaxID=241271 RepID=UPI001BD3B15F|nr:major histocompatibility complex class I-related gene protein-like [Cheilinus undulatus]
MKILSFLLIFCHVSSTVEHSLEFFATGFHGFPDFPEFEYVLLVDGVELGYCDSDTKTLKLHDWTREFMSDNPDYLQLYSEMCLLNQYSLKALIVDVMQGLNQSEGMHILQRISGCEWDEEIAETASFLKLGYDGEDFMALDLQASTWTALKPEALTAKLKWDADKLALHDDTSFYNYECSFWLKKYLLYGRKYLGQTVLPSVSLLQKSSSSPVSCFATGFYPDRAAMFWRKDGEELYEGVDHGEILPNNDDTFQMRADLNISSVKLEDWEKYECVFQLSGVEEDIITKLDKSVIRSNNGKSDTPRVPAVIGVAAGLLLLSVCIAGFIVWRKKKNGLQVIQWEQDNEGMALDSSM